METKTRPLTSRDLDAVLSIEGDVFARPRTRREYERLLGMASHYGVAAVHPTGRVLGFAFLAKDGSSLEIRSMAIAREHWREHHGQAIVAEVKRQMEEKGFRRLTAMVSESNLAGQLFFAACGFVMKETIRQPYEQCDDDGYLFVFEARPKPFMPVNRIKKFMQPKVNG